MNFILRGLLTLKEKKGKAIILLSVMLTVCVVMLSSFAIQSGADAAAVLAREKLGAQVTVSQNMENMMNKQREESSTSEDGKPARLKMEKTEVPLEYADILSESEYVLGYLASSSTTANLTDLLPVGTEEEEESTTTTSIMTEGNKDMPAGGGGDMKFMGTGDVTISGVNDYEMSSQYVNGKVELTDGRAITEDDLGSNVVMVEKTFAEENEISVGDKFSIENVSFSRGNEDETSTEETITLEVEVVGIYSSDEEVSSMGFKNTASLPYNTMIAPYTLVSSLNGSEDTTGVDSLLFYINDPVNVDSFVKFAEGTSIDLETFSIDAGTEEYESMMEPIENVAEFSKITIIIVSIFGGVILGLIIMLSIKSRITEIGILMALGERRVKIIGQFLIEALVTLVIAFGISIAAGSLISDKVADVLLQKELTTTSQTESSNQMGSMNDKGGNRPSGMGMPGGSMTKEQTVEKISSLDINISLDNIMNMGMLAVIVVVLATILPSIIIMRYNPKKILSNHS